MTEEMMIDSATHAYLPGITILAFTVANAIITFIAIFLFKNFRIQKRMIKCGIFISVLIIAATAAHSYLAPCAEECCCIAKTIALYIPMPMALIFQYWALNRVKHDERLLRSADRIR